MSIDLLLIGLKELDALRRNLAEERLVRMTGRLIRQLNVRDQLLVQRQRHYDHITAILQASSPKRSKSLRPELNWKWVNLNLAMFIFLSGYTWGNKRKRTSLVICSDCDFFVQIRNDVSLTEPEATGERPEVGRFLLLHRVFPFKQIMEFGVDFTAEMTGSRHLKCQNRFIWIRGINLLFSFVECNSLSYCFCRHFLQEHDTENSLKYLLQI